MKCESCTISQVLGVKTMLRRKIRLVVMQNVLPKRVRGQHQSPAHQHTSTGTSTSVRSVRACMCSYVVLKPFFLLLFLPQVLGVKACLKFDLKGSSLGRKASTTERSKGASCTWKVSSAH